VGSRGNQRGGLRGDTKARRVVEKSRALEGERQKLRVRVALYIAAEAASLVRGRSGLREILT
jgi:hypothetical protein